MTTMDTTTPDTAAPADFGAELRQNTAAIRLQHEKLGVCRTLEADQLREAADAFGATTRSILASKKMLDTGHSAYRAVTNIRSQATAYWRSMTVPYPEPGIRLIRRDRIPAFEAQLREFRAELADAAADLQAVYPDLCAKASRDLGELYNPDDYPVRIDTEFALGWDYPSTDPPAYMRALHPELYAREQQRIAGRFDEAIRLTEEAFAAELAGLVEHLAERLSGDADGRPKIFRGTVITNLQGFISRFRDMSLRSNSDLDALVSQAEDLVGGVEPDQLRSSRTARDRISLGMAEIGRTLDGLMVERARRSIRFADDKDESEESPEDREARLTDEAYEQQRDRGDV